MESFDPSGRSNNRHGTVEFEPGVPSHGVSDKTTRALANLSGDAALMLSWRLRLGLMAVPLLGVAVATLIVGAPSPVGISHAVRAAGPIAPVVFIIVYVGWTVLMFPGSVATLAAGALFGIPLGGALALTGAEMGAIAAYLVARRIGRRDPDERAGARAVRLERWLDGNGFRALLAARLMPAVPFNALNYAAGVAGIRLRPYVTATAIGIVPGTLAYVALGSSLTHRGSPAIVVSLYAVRTLAVVGIIGHRWRQRIRRRAAGRLQTEGSP